MLLIPPRTTAGVLVAAAALGASTMFPSMAQAARVEIASATASSTYPPDDGGSYDAAKLIDGKVATSWVEGEEGSGLGAWVELDLGGARDVDTVKFWAGMWYSSDFWYRGNRPKQIDLEFSDGSKHTCQLDDSQTVQVCSFPKKNTSRIKAEIKQVYSGSAWFDTGISEIQVFDTSDDGRAKVKEVKASSELPADADGSYGTSNMIDDIVDTMWCEGSKDGDGSGEWLEFHFDGPTTIGSLSIVNGVGGNMLAWTKANYATSATLRFSDGSTHKVQFKNKFAKPEKVQFPARQASSVKITFDEVTRGKEYNDLCMSELVFGK